MNDDGVGVFEDNGGTSSDGGSIFDVIHDEMGEQAANKPHEPPQVW